MMMRLLPRVGSLYAAGLDVVKKGGSLAHLVRVMPSVVFQVALSQGRWFAGRNQVIC